MHESKDNPVKFAAWKFDIYSQQCCQKSCFFNRSDESECISTSALNKQTINICKGRRLGQRVQRLVRLFCIAASNQMLLPGDGVTCWQPGGKPMVQ